jgi:ABC-type Fe3+-hydroxamate transport system substrate-binding protein
MYMSENKKQRFQRLAMNRVNKAIKSIELIGNLGNKSLYESTSDERKKIIKAINDSVAQMKTDLDGNSKKREGFKFD